MNTQQKITVKMTGNPYIAGDCDKDFTRFGRSPAGIWGIHMRARGIDTKAKKKCTIYWDKSDPAVECYQNGLGFHVLKLSSEIIGRPTIVFDDGTVLDTEEVDIVRHK
ncbi:hypothetical protein [Conchiformibius steedae]|uniref:hypothetical protein n=1 Tax=Conchiformibius steedae TaxID=153493 RepID=UPI0026EB321E|nr:hypothetical protein [Conchiformibius steedae]